MHTLELPLQGNPGSISDSRGKAFYPSFFLSFLLAFSSSSDLYKVIKNLYLSLEKAQCKNNSLPRWHVPNGIFTTRLVDGIRYTDVYTSTLRVSDQHQKVVPRANIHFRISRSDSRFWGNDIEPSQV